MTKTVRIENADTTTYKIKVEIWDKGFDGSPDILVGERCLDYPTAMTNDLYITSTRYLVIKEYE